MAFVGSKELHAIIGVMLNTWHAKSIAVMGASPGLGDVPAGRMAARRVGAADIVDFNVVDYPLDSGNEADYLNTWDNLVPEVPVAGNNLAKVETAFAPTDGAGGNHFVSMAEARERIRWAANDVLLKCEANLPDGYRGWATRANNRVLMDREIETANQLLLASEKRREQKKKGFQCISTSRKRKSMPVESYFTFNGRPSWRARQGRPALSETEWKRRYRLRLQKNKKTRRRSKARAVQTPITKHPRPTNNKNLGCSRLLKKLELD